MEACKFWLAWLERETRDLKSKNNPVGCGGKEYPGVSEGQRIVLIDGLTFLGEKALPLPVLLRSLREAATKSAAPYILRVLRNR